MSAAASHRFERVVARSPARCAGDAYAPERVIFVSAPGPARAQVAAALFNQPANRDLAHAVATRNGLAEPAPPAALGNV